MLPGVDSRKLVHTEGQFEKMDTSKKGQLENMGYTYEKGDGVTPSFTKLLYFNLIILFVYLFNYYVLVDK